MRVFPPWTRGPCERCGQECDFSRSDPVEVEDGELVLCEFCEGYERGEKENAPVSLEKARAQPSKDAVEFLEHMLEEAKSGEVQAFVIATVRQSGDVGASWAGRDSRFDWYRLIGALEHLKWNMLRVGTTETEEV